ncbi:N-acetyltransferase [Granulicatella sp. zg-ZJ]|uniref:N-acetyltransferase n=1 Tax=Granulicatella sp. zg-ZJ TaxID=2678504 RepID=UPI0013D4A54F|nr:N-acetyltransferase [Granulicatella sp. zg-ZJ]MBS4750465.1 N-acetyltransferase [Carnobacteriaceae bacterium zg-ZUI78]NEW63269.1 N-acetyltransferase [Granulicatella sp. zg-ZJ]
MKIVHAKVEQLPQILNIYAYAREQMKKSGNPNQWKDNRPPIDAIKEDIRQKRCFLLVEKDVICGVFAFMIEPDIYYRAIYHGNWLNDEPYGVIHRVASSGQRKGVLNDILDYCETQIDNIRIDTHEDNRIMQHLLEKRAYVKCGIIFVDDQTPRLAYQKVIDKKHN